MKILDDGHLYELADLRGNGTQIISFYKDASINGSHRDGCSLQEVIRVLIDRILFLDNQKQAPENSEIVTHARHMIRLLEARAARISVEKGERIELSPIGKSGHWHK